jgi:8-oxo-dGTP pyrophosphatase MutT (NUDIX family)
MAEQHNPWTKLSTRAVYDNPWISLSEHQVITPGGTPGIYGTVNFKNKSVGVIAIDSDRHIWLVSQYRLPIERRTWELPEGGSPAGESPLDAAKRELREETGLVAQRWRELCRLHPSNAVTDEEAILFVAEDLTMGEHEREDCEADMQRRRVSFANALAMVLQGEITDAMTVVGILRLARELTPP